MFFTLILSSFLTFVELNCENLFDTKHDSLKNDYEFLPQSSYKWTPYRYWRKLANLSKTIVALGYEDLSLVGTASPDNPSRPSEKSWHVPDFVALCEVENDSVLFDLTRRSALRGVNYDYVMTDSPDDRGDSLGRDRRTARPADASHRRPGTAYPATHFPSALSSGEILSGGG